MSKADKNKSSSRTRSYKRLKQLEGNATQSQLETLHPGDEEIDSHGKKKRKRRKKENTPEPTADELETNTQTIVPASTGGSRPSLGPPSVLMERQSGSVPGRREQEGVAIQAIQLAISNAGTSSQGRLPSTPEALGSPDDEMSEVLELSRSANTSSDTPANCVPSTSTRPPKSLDKGKSKELPPGSSSDELDKHLQALYNSGSEQTAYETVCALLQQLIVTQKELVETQNRLTGSSSSVQAGPDNQHNQGDRGNRDAQLPKRKDVPAANDPEVPWDQEVVHRFESGVQHRGPERNAILGCIRNKYCIKLGRESPDDPLPPDAPPEVAVATSTTFGLRYYESETSTYNKSAAAIVIKEVKREWPAIYARFGDAEMMKMSTGHIKYLSKLYKRQNDPAKLSKEETRKRRCAADTRKRSLYYQRLKAVQELPSLHRHGRLLEALGIDGTSSDEEDPDVPGTYIIKRRRPLSESVYHLFGQIDQAYLVHFKGPGSKGNQVRRRVDKGVLSKRKFEITGIPISCMDPDWLHELSHEHKELLEFADIEYDFTFPLALLQPPPV
ncbi:hypothetical protein RSOL_522710, partial [Rhizoctonia solani AG-3 Rhs1AP]